MKTDKPPVNSALAMACFVLLVTAALAISAVGTVDQVTFVYGGV